MFFGKLMFTLGLLLTVVYIPSLTGASIQTQWALLSLALPILLWRSAESSPTGLHYLGAVFFSWAVLGLLWSPQVQTTILGLWFIILWGLSFQLGYVTADPRPLLRGLAVGLYINIAVAIAQAFGWTGIPIYSTYPAGFLYNSTLFGAACALGAIALAQYRLWLWALPLLLGVALSHSLGAVLILFVAAASVIHWAAPFTAFALAPFVSHSLPNIQRLEIWGTILHALTWRGWSAGSTDMFYYIVGNSAIHPEYAHNDFIQFIFEFGIGAAVPFAIIACAFLWRRTPLLYACAALACFYFPFYAPVTAFIFCFALGHSLRGFSLYGLFLSCRRPDLLSRVSEPQPITSIPWRGYLPLLPRFARS